jgi:hypothetical protein
MCVQQRVGSFESRRAGALPACCTVSTEFDMSNLLTSLGYIDPGTGSFLLQILFAGVLGGLATLKFYWSRVRDFFTRQDPEVGGGR